MEKEELLEEILEVYETYKHDNRPDYEEFGKEVFDLLVGC